MTGECLEFEQLAEVMRLAESDPRRAHVASCPRCRMQWRLYQRFLDPGPAPSEAHLAEARRRISLGIEEGLGSDAGERRLWLLRLFGQARPGSPEGPRSSRRPDWRPALGPAWRRALRPVWRPALGLIGVTAAAILVLRWSGEPRRGEQVVLRENPAATAAASAPTLLEPIRAEDGSVTLRWSATPEADSYDVILYGTDLEEKARLRAGSDTTLRLDPERSGLLREAPFYAVSALNGGDEIGRSDPRIVEEK